MTNQELAREALHTGAWEQAAAKFATIAEETQDPAAFEGMSQAAWWLDDAKTCIGAREAAYRGYRERGDDLGAGRAATALGWDSLLFGQGQAVAQGWLGRARELLERFPDSEEQGWLAVRQAELALAVLHDPAAALTAAERACSLGRVLDVRDLEVVGLALSGLAMTGAGDLAQGMPRLDTAVAAATAGDVQDLMWMGKVCCWLIAACQETQDLSRAGDWCRRVQAICAERDLAPLFSVCRIQYASILVARGTWPEAERELNATLDRLSGSQRASRLEAVVQLGELRRRQGRLAEADELLAQAEFHPTAVIGRALIRLAQGDATGAWSTVSRVVRSLPVADRLDRAAVLLPAVVVAAAAGEAEAAAMAADELRGTAQLVGTDSMLGLSAAADAELAPPEEVVRLRSEAVRHFQQAGLRFDEAQARLDLAASMIDDGDLVGAREHVTLATEALSELAAAGGLAAARSLADRAGSPSSDNPLTPREVEVLRLVSQGLSNAQIAAALTVSEHTVHRHVANILTKLNQPTRAAATAFAMSNGML